MNTESQDQGPNNRETLDRLREVDEAAFQAVAGWRSPVLDSAIPILSQSANNAVLWMGTASLIAILGGRRGRRIAAEALVAVGVTSAVANLAAKNLVRRTRPASSVPIGRRLEKPDSSSFPSGHTASAAAFSSVVGGEIGAMYLPINIAAGAVGFSRVYTGVHYPGDVLAGWVLGRLVGRTVRALWPKRWR